ncbi:MAG: tetratricopeptide repeat protein [Verrucomicrobiales bacterium]|nr:tetratricopeptide repeat protein [Verrucomicrobiales bacterium]
MTSLYSRSHLVTLSRLDRVLWESNSLVSLFIDEVAADRFLEDHMGPHLRSHQTENMTVIVSPESESGILHALAEAILAFSGATTADELSKSAPEEWPEKWSQNDHSRVHRLLIIDQFEQILNASEWEKEFFCALLAHFSAEQNTSVLTVFERQSAGSISGLPGFCHLDKEGAKIQVSGPEKLPPLAELHRPALKRRWTLFSTGIVTVVSVLVLFFVCQSFANHPGRLLREEDQITAEKYSGFLKNPYSIPPFVYIQKSRAILPKSTGPVIPAELIPSYSLTPVGLFPAASQISQEFDAPAGFSTAPVSRPALKVKDLLEQFEKSDGMTYDDLVRVCRVMQIQSPLADAGPVLDWMSGFATGSENFDLQLSRAYAELEDREATFRWYERYAERTGELEALCDIAAAYLFGRGTDVDYTAAMYHLETARNAGSGNAVYLFGVAQLQGRGVDQNRLAAYYTFVDAIKLGSPLAHRDAARMLELGYGVDQNLYWAFHLYEEGAKLGDRYCMQRVSEILRTGENRLFPVDREKADSWERKKESVPPDPVHSCVREAMADDFYYKKVVRTTR